MNTHLKMQIQNVGNMIFKEISPNSITLCKNTAIKDLNNPTYLDFWQNVKSFFSNNDALNIPRSIQVPCFYVLNTNSTGRHRQHLYISDINNNVFQIYSLMHSDFISISDQHPMAAVAQALIKNDISGVDDWFKDYQDYSLNHFKTVIQATLEEINSSQSISRNKDTFNCFMSAFFDFLNFQVKVEIESYQFDGLPDLSTLFFINKEPFNDSTTIENFKTELQYVLSQLD